jgi:hypothetical protein
VNLKARVHQGVEMPHRQLFPMEFLTVHWDQHCVQDHDGRVLVILMKEYNVYRRADMPEEHWALMTGIYKVCLGGAASVGNRAFCFRKIDEYRGANPAGWSPTVLEIVDQFLTRKEATDATKSIPEADQGA